MWDESVAPWLKAAFVAALFGGATRIALELKNGSRGVKLAVDGFAGGMLGVMGAGFLMLWDALLLDDQLFFHPMLQLLVGAVGGSAGALGTRVLDMVEAYLRKRLGLDPGAGKGGGQGSGA